MFRSFPAVLLALSLFSVSALAEEQMSRGYQVVHGREDKEVHYAHKSFGGGQNFNGTSKARVKSFSMLSLFRAKSFSTSNFWGAKSYNNAGKYQGSKPANLSTKYAMQAKDKKVEVKTAETKAAREEGKEYESKTYATRTGVWSGKAQAQLDADVPNRKNLTIDQVRELLNKNE